jgi:hypothetical protein
MSAPLLHTRAQACELLGGISMDHFETYWQPRMRIVRSGRLRLVPASELERVVRELARFPG